MCSTMGKQTEKTIDRAEMELLFANTQGPECPLKRVHEVIFGTGGGESSSNLASARKTLDDMTDLEFLNHWNGMV